MKRKNNILGWLLLIYLSLSSSIAIYSQTDYNKIIFDTYIKGDMGPWKTVIMGLEKKVGNDIHGQLELINYYYGYTGWLIRMEDDDLADKSIDKTNELIDRVLKKSPNDATAWAYKGALAGMEIGLHPYKAMFMGPKSIEYIDKSLSLDPQNTQGHLEKGNASYYTPSMFGGSKTEAIESYKKAIRLMESNKLTNENWMYINALTVLAQAYEKTDQFTKADQVYKKILKLEPNFTWVKDELYPNFKKKSSAY